MIYCSSSSSPWAIDGTSIAERGTVRRVSVLRMPCRRRFRRTPHRGGLSSRATVRAGLQCPDSSASSQTTVKFGQDFQVGKVLYQKVRFLSEGWYRVFWGRRSCTKKCERTLQMVSRFALREDPDQIEHPCCPWRLAPRKWRSRIFDVSEFHPFGGPILERLRYQTLRLGSC